MALTELVESIDRIFRYDDINWNQSVPILKVLHGMNTCYQWKRKCNCNLLHLTATNKINKLMILGPIYRWNQSQWVRIGGDIFYVLTQKFQKFP